VDLILLPARCARGWGIVRWAEWVESLTADLSIVDRQLSRGDMSTPRTEVPYGTLDLVILKTLDTMGAMHGYSIARRIEQVADNLLHMSQGSIYPALIRLEQQGWIRTQWGISETNRRVKVYSLTAAGTRQLRVEVANWQRATALVARFLEAGS
jgi:PadR family transcriptional regulator, regulatory protein PadR